jgi:hypothetical protein
MTRLAVWLVSLAATLLAAAPTAQVVDDEQRLKGIEQQLARAWSQHDRAFIESVLAQQWSVTQPDGQVLTRAVVLGPFFNAVTFDSNVIDDVSVHLFRETAVVRGRTTASGTFNGTPVKARIRFTDVFIKRQGQWQVVASHASSLIADAQPTAAAQSRAADSSEAGAFIGTWVFAMTNPAGAQETVRIWDEHGTLAASVQTERFPPITAAGIFQDGDILVLTTTLFENGKPDRAVISITPDGDDMKMAMMLEFSETIKRGRARRQQP